MKTKFLKLIKYILLVLIIEVIVFILCLSLTIKRVSPDFLYNIYTYESLIILKSQEDLDIKELNNLYNHYFFNEKPYCRILYGDSFEISEDKFKALKVYLLRLRILNYDVYYDTLDIDKDIFSIISSLGDFNIELWDTKFPSVTLNTYPTFTSSKNFISKELRIFLLNEVYKK